VVLSATGNRIVPPELSREVADLIPTAKLLEFPGTDALFWSEANEAILEEVEEFLTGARTGDSDRVLATLLFTDIVRSTDLAAQLGDRRWRDLLDQHHEVVRRELGRFRGREVVTTGDGFLATFDAPARAVRCGRAIIEGAASLGLDVRAGVHIGEVEVRGQDVGGLAVHIGARVAALAEGGEVLVSSTVKDLLAGAPLRFEDRGEHELKGVPGTWRVFAAAEP
jgi:class 3 adenylate cyclase